jgi:hypothetical protein
MREFRQAPRAAADGGPGTEGPFGDPRNGRPPRRARGITRASRGPAPTGRSPRRGYRYEDERDDQPLPGAAQQERGGRAAPVPSAVSRRDGNGRIHRTACRTRWRQKWCVAGGKPAHEEIVSAHRTPTRGLNCPDELEVLKQHVATVAPGTHQYRATDAQGSGPFAARDPDWIRLRAGVESCVPRQRPKEVSAGRMTSAVARAGVALSSSASSYRTSSSRSRWLRVSLVSALSARPSYLSVAKRCQIVVGREVAHRRGG